MASSSSSSTPAKYEVFISFRGSDVRFGFLSHLEKALSDKTITFVDTQLERGEEISSSLLETIERSAISLVIFSENYANSPWCLEELVKILECKKTKGQEVIPVFYRIKPDDVQELTGSFGEAIAKHKQDISLPHEVENWCQALRETSNLSGLDSNKFGSESVLIDEIIEEILKKLNHLFRNDCYYDDGLVGMGSRVEKVKSLLCCQDVRVVGIWGVGGVGKSTIANKVFDEICGEYESCCFVENVSEKFEKCQDAIHNELLSKLLDKESSDIRKNVTRRRLSRKKVLIVLDDVSDLDQIKSITQLDYGTGSRIIVTSRDKQLLKNVNAQMYEVEALNEREALQLFCLHAFKQSIPQKEFTELSETAVKYAGGLPLALEVLGCNLLSKSVEEWEDELENLNCTSNDKVHRILRRSYDGLSKNEKEIFLDIACFFKGYGRSYVESILAVVSGSKIGISRLVDKSLIFISSQNCVNIHDLIQQMGMEIESEEQKLKKRRRLWKSDEIVQLLTKKKGSDATKGLSLDMSKIKDIYLSSNAFKKMDNLKYLIFYYGYNSEIKVHLPEGLEYLAEKLRYLCWDGYPLKSLPPSFCAENLVQLSMPYSNLEELWNGVQNLANLKWINLSYSKLRKLPDLSRSTNLEVLELERCTNLVEIPSSLTYLTKLMDLNVQHCRSLSRLPSCLHLINLQYLDFMNCKELTMFPNIACYERHPRNAVEKVPSSIGCQFQLTQLSLFGCSRLEWLPDSICNLIHLERLDISACESLHELPENLGNLKCLEELYASESGISKLPDSICSLKNLYVLDVNKCVNLSGLPQNLGNLESLNVLSAHETGIKELPSSINGLRKLSILDLGRSKGLKLPQVFMSGTFPNLTNVDLSYCGISEFPDSLCFVTSLERLNLSGNNFESIPKYLKQLSRLKNLSFRDCERLKYIQSITEIVDVLKKGMTDVDFMNCINLDRSQCNQMADQLLMTRDLHQYYKLRIPGSELPQKMKYQNINGSSLSFSFELGRNLTRKLDLNSYLCVVLDPQVREFCDGEFDIGFNAYLKDESGHCLDELHPTALFTYPNGEKVYRSTHVLLICCNFYSIRLFDGNKYTIVFKFYIQDTFDERRIRYDGIIKCGVHPAFGFEHQLIG